MAENTHNAYDLAQMQALSLDSKIAMTKQRITQWYEAFDGQVYVSFSGGKDSTVLLTIAREIYPDIEGVFVDTGLEYPEVREHVKSFDNITWLKPEKNFKQVIMENGYPLISKETAQIIKEARWGIEKGDGSYSYRLDALNGTKIDPKTGKKSHFNCERWKFLLDSPFKISDDCCKIMKKKPAKKFEHETGKKAILGQMADESKIRYQTWIRYGCNAYQKKRATSNPMSFWTEQDVLEYIVKYNVKIPSVYGDIVKTGRTIERLDGTHDELKCSKAERTGCMFCAFGCHLRYNQFQELKVLNPKIYDYCMKPTSDGGLGYKEVLDWMNENGNLNIKY